MDCKPGGRGGSIYTARGRVDGIEDGNGKRPSQYGTGWEQIDNASGKHSLTCPYPWMEGKERRFPYQSTYHPSIHVTALLDVGDHEPVATAVEKGNLPISATRTAHLSVQVRSPTDAPSLASIVVRRASACHRIAGAVVAKTRIPMYTDASLYPTQDVSWLRILGPQAAVFVSEAYDCSPALTHALRRRSTNARDSSVPIRSRDGNNRRMC